MEDRFWGLLYKSFHVNQISAQLKRTEARTDTGCLPATTHHDLCHCHVLLPILPFDWETQSPCSSFLNPDPRPPPAGLWGRFGCYVATEYTGLRGWHRVPVPPLPPPISRRSQSTLEEVKSGEPAWGSHPSFSWMGFEDNKPVAPGRMETKCAVTEPGFMAPNFTDLPHRNEDW